MASLRAGILGLGMMGRNHARVLASLDGVELVVAADPSGDRHGAAPSVVVGEGVEHIIAARPDYVVVSVPTALHESATIALADAGISVLVEKPVAPDPSSARRMVEAIDRNGVVGAVGHIERYNPAIRNLRAKLAEGLLGAVYQVTTSRQGPFPARIADVGVVKDLATHDIDLTCFVTGDTFASVAAQTLARSGREHEDLISVSGQLRGGAVTAHLVNWLSPFKERRTVVTGEAGALVADTLTADLTFYANGTLEQAWDGISAFRGVSEGDMRRFALAKPEPLRTEHEQFRDAVMGKPAEYVSFREGLATVEVAEAMLHSASAGVVVDLPTV